MRAISRGFPILVRVLRQPCAQLRSYATKARSKPSPVVATTVTASVPIKELRNYQKDCIQTIIEQIDSGVRRMGVSLATGGGKTIIFTQLIDKVTHPTLPEATQTLILVHRRELVEQAARQSREHYPDKSIEIEMASSHATGLADITVASIQSITSGDRIEKFDPKRFKLILVDECHHAVASGYLRCLDHFGLLQVEEKSPVLVGVTATMSRFDGLRLGKVLDKVVYHRGFLDMVQDGWLSPCKFTTIKSSVDLTGVRNSPTGDFLLQDLGKSVNTEEANEVTVRGWMEKAGDRKSTLVFCVDIAHVKAITAKFRSKGIDAQYITSETILQVRRERLTAFKNREYPVLVNCGIFTEGTDIPNIDCVLLARPTRSKNLMVQMIGRGMRLHEGKVNCHVIDMVGNVEKGIITTPTLFGLDPDELVEDATVADMQALAQKLEEPPDETPARPLNVTFSDYENIWDLLGDQNEDNHIRQISSLSWVTVGNDKYILSLRTGFLRIEREEDETFSVTEVRRVPREVTKGKSPFTKPRKIVTSAATLHEAAHGADTYAQNVYSPRIILLHNAAWRKTPASKEQLELLSKISGRDLDESLTKGQAGDMITKFRHGAQGRFDRLLKQKNKEEKLRAKYEALGNREVVRVGDLNK